ncbi:MAG: peptide ABC transporter substrate-binding protein [Termitinemataceae bacterium]|nr:MAG: peptide ABC transporter substrate-binding protein [Termitinemataceae bacterium]
MHKKKKQNNLNGWVSMQSKAWQFVFFTLSVALAFLSCNSAPKTAGKTAKTQTEDNYAATRPKVFNKETLTVSFSGNGIEYDFRKSYMASEAQVYTALYEGLFSYHPLTMEPLPAACETWNLSKDKKEWTFTIRSGAKYWNGDDVKAEDFRAAWLSILDPKANSPYSSLFDIIEGALEYRLGQNSNKNTVGIEAVDDKTLKVKLITPADFFRSMLCHHSFSPIHPSMLKIADWSSKPPISNGAFYVFEDKDKKKTLRRNEFYWGAGDVELKTIIIKYSDDPDEAAALWNSGECRWIQGDVNVEALSDRSGIMVNEMFATQYYYICSRRKPWDKAEVRSALSLALPWEEIRKEYRMPAKTLIYPILGYPKIKGVDTTDIAAAKKLLQDAGYEGGKGLPELVLRLNPSSESQRIGTLMAETWKGKLGVPVRVEVLPYSSYFDSLKKGDYDVGASTWIGDFADPYTFLQMWRRDSNLNDAGNNDADFESLIDKSMSEEGSKRLHTLSEAEEILLKHGTVLPISYSLAVNIIDDSEIDGWYGNALDIHPFKYLSFKRAKPLPGVVLAK